jgi:hypothetical protein
MLGAADGKRGNFAIEDRDLSIDILGEIRYGVIKIGGFSIDP